MTTKLHGPVLCGFADLYELPERQHLVGGGVPTIKDAAPSKAKKWVRTPLDKPKAQKLHPTHNLAPLSKATKKAGTVVKAAMASLKRKPNTMAAKAAVKLHGLIAMLGAVTTNKKGKPLTPKQQAAVSKASLAQKKASAATGALKMSTAKALKAGKAAVAVSKDVKAKFKTSVRGDGLDLLGAEPDPFNPGYLDDGSPDPAYDWSGVDFAYDPALDAPLPPEPPLTPAPPLNAVINTPVPADGIRYDGPITPYDVGSYWYWYGPQSTKPGPVGEMGITGFCWGWNHANWPQNLGEQWVWLTGQDSITKDQKWNVAPTPTMTTDHVADLSVRGHGSQGLDLGPGVNVFGQPWGPLIGNPNRPNTKNLRYSMADKCWFWYLEEAPDAISQPIKYAAERARQAAIAAEAAAAEAAAKQQAKDAADLAAAQAAQDAQLALAEEAAISQYNIAETAAAAQDFGLQQQQAQLDLQAQQAQMEMDKQQMQLDMQRQAAEQQMQLQQMKMEQQMQMQQMQMEEQRARMQQAMQPPLQYESQEGQYQPQGQQEYYYEEAAPEQPAQPQYAPAPSQFDNGEGEYDPEAMAELEAEGLYGSGGDAIIGADGKAVQIDEWGNPR